MLGFYIFSELYVVAEYELSCQLADPVHVAIVALPDEADRSTQKIVVTNVVAVVIMPEIVHCIAEDVDGNYNFFMSSSSISLLFSYFLLPVFLWFTKLAILSKNLSTQLA